MNHHTSSDIHLPKELVDKIENGVFHNHESLLEVQKDLESFMNGLSTHDSFEDNLLVAEYARNRGIISLPVRIRGLERVVRVPGVIDTSGNAIIILSKKSISYVSELQTLLDEYEIDRFVESEYRLIHVSNDPSDALRNTLLSLIYSNYAASVTSPLKQDIIPLIVAGTGYNLPLQEPESSPKPISRLVERKYLVGKNKETSWFREMGEKHEMYYQHFFGSIWENTPDAVFLTASGLSANAATIRYVSSQISPDAISVAPGYFFLNEVNFPEGTTDSIIENTQALFCAIEPGYAGLGDSGRYVNNIGKNIDQFIKNAKENPLKPYFFAIDVTSDLLGNQDIIAHMEQLKQYPNITVVITSSLTKYNRSESNYHYGIAAVFGNTETEASMKKYIATSYGDISRLGVLQFPRLRPSEIRETKDACQKNRQICMNVLLETPGVTDLVTIENHSAYTYMIPLTEDVGVRNNMISSILDKSELQKWQGSSFYHDSLRICDVPDIACSRFHPGEDTQYKNSLRISWPAQISREEMEKLGKLLATYILGR